MPIQCVVHLMWHVSGGSYPMMATVIMFAPVFYLMPPLYLNIFFFNMFYNVN